MAVLFLVVVWIVAAFLVFAALVPFSKLQFGLVQGLAFPRQQFLGAAVLCGILLPILQPGSPGLWGAALMAGVALIQAVFILKFTPLWARQSVDADDNQRADKKNHLSLLTANVKKSNRAYGRLIDLIKDRQPDVVMAIEVDQDWIDALKKPLAGDFDHWVEVPMDNGYGLCVMSRLPLFETEVAELITQDVPSVHTGITLRSGQQARLYAVHPEPPVIDHDTIGRDSEIALIGLQAKDDRLPSIVTGDLNDVAWSSTTRRFQRLTRLLDPRVGRGFYNTFSATMPWMRWPLDHLFHDARFRLVDMARERKIGSDHFPMWFVLALAQTGRHDSDPGEASQAEVKATKREIVEERRRARGPIGSDWEDE